MTPTPSQNEVITSQAPTVIAIAGPGSGKTATIVRRYMHRQQEGKTAIITFTNNAARTLRERIAQAGGEPPYFCGTLHAFCLDMLRQSGRRLTVLDESTAEGVLMECAAAVNCQTTGKKLREIITGVNTSPSMSERTAVERYKRRLAAADVTDYDLLLEEGLNHLKAGYGPALDHLMVDESQDGARIDSDIYRALKANIRTLVGDFDQSIYGFRGACPEALRSFMPGAHVVKLQANFRSDSSICQAAQKVITKNTGRFSKDTISQSGAVGVVSMLPGAPFDSDESEAAGIVQWVKESVGTVAVLCRYNATRIAITDQMVAAGLMARPVSNEPKDWKFCLATLAAWSDPENEIAVAAWLRSRHGATASQAMMDEAAGQRKTPPLPFAGMPLVALMESQGFSIAAREMILGAADGLGDGQRILMNLRETEPKAAANGRVSVLTCHSAKGLEFDSVIIPACEEEVFKPWDAEERRLFFVAMTRARSTLLFSYAKTRRQNYGAKQMAPARRSLFLADALS